MLIKKKNNNFIYIEFIKKIFFKFFFYTGVIFFSFFLILSIYFFSSGMGSPKNVFLKVNDKILNRYLGFDIRKSKNYIEILKISFLSNFKSSQLENVYLNVNQKSILGLEMQRKSRSQNGGELPKEEFNTFPAELVQDNKVFKIKIRTKGVRPIHWKNRDQTSYKIDLLGSERAWGLEEFALQKPITRNYIYEYLFHELLGHVDLLRIKYFFVNLFFNDNNLGVYAVEESFSKELIERQKKRNGPIFGLSEELGEYFPNVKFDLYSENFWINEHPQLVENLFSVLNNLKNDKDIINNYFDLDKWAKYFAIIDLAGSYHGLLSKSVKFYYNPTTGLFEPIGYDIHKGAGIFDNFIILDFLQETKPNCSYLCLHKEWFFKFLKKNEDELNFQFLELYIKYLKEFSDKNFVNKFLEKHENKINTYNSEFYKEKSKVDKITYTGLGYFVYDKNYLLKRAELIKSRINSIQLTNVSISKLNNNFLFEDYQASMFPIKAKFNNCSDQKENKYVYLAGRMKFKLNNSCKNIILYDNKEKEINLALEKNIKLSDDITLFQSKELTSLKDNINIIKINQNEFVLKDNLKITENTILNSNDTLSIYDYPSIDINNNASLIIEGNIVLNNDEKDFIKIYSSDKSGSIIFRNNIFNLHNIHFNNLSKPYIDNYILYGGVNFVDTKVALKNIVVTNSNEEDAMNIINSNSEIFNIKFENIFADALDIDFGKSSFSKISCFKINNDCLDLSGVNVNGSDISVEKSKDKAISIGENSFVKIQNLNLNQNNVGVAVKDGSISNLTNFSTEGNNFDVLLFNKKKEFNKPSLNIFNYSNLNLTKILQSEGTNLKINKKIFFGKLKDEYINSLIY